MSTASQDYPPRVQVLFCDGVRREEGGKLSIMGVYAQILAFAEPMIVMPQFCVMFIVDLPGALETPTIQLSLMDRGQPLLAADVVLNKGAPWATTLTHRHSAMLPLETMGFAASNGMVLRARAVIDGVLDYTSDALMVVSLPNGPDSVTPDSQ